MIAVGNPLIAASLLLLAGPLFACVTLWAKVAHGTVFTVERRRNRHGNWYRHWRFRTSPPARPLSPSVPGSGRFAVYTFPPDTLLGVCLHRTRTENLPGLWNVFRGDIDIAEFLARFADDPGCR